MHTKLQQFAYNKDVEKLSHASARTQHSTVNNQTSIEAATSLSRSATATSSSVAAAAFVQPGSSKAPSLRPQQKSGPSLRPQQSYGQSGSLSLSTGTAFVPSSSVQTNTIRPQHASSAVTKQTKQPVSLQEGWHHPTTGGLIADDVVDVGRSEVCVRV
jgi:hypothetical protein